MKSRQPIRRQEQITKKHTQSQIQTKDKKLINSEILWAGYSLHCSCMYCTRISFELGLVVNQSFIILFSSTFIFHILCMLVFSARKYYLSFLFFCSIKAQTKLSLESNSHFNLYIISIWHYRKDVSGLNCGNHSEYIFLPVLHASSNIYKK